MAQKLYTTLIFSETDNDLTWGSDTEKGSYAAVCIHNLNTLNDAELLKTMKRLLRAAEVRVLKK